MKRKMHATFGLTQSSSSTANYSPLLNQEEDAGSSTTEFSSNPRKTKSILCNSSKKRLYFLMILIGVVLLWIGIYYKLLNHRFDLPEPFRELRRIFGDGPSKKRKFREFETENVENSNHHLPEKLHIVIVACKSRITEAMISLKAMTLVTKYSLNFYIFTDKKNYQLKTIDNILIKWPAYQQRWMMFFTYAVIYPDSISSDERKEWEHLFKPCASFRLFLANANSLPSVDSIIYVDTDTLFLQPPEDLWQYFAKFNQSHIAGLARECQKGQQHCWYENNARHRFVEPYGVNTGVMLMNLTRMRKVLWENELIEIYWDNKEKLAYGDQDVLNIYFHDHPDQLYILTCNWNYRPEFCMMGEDNNLCEEARSHGVSLLHGNRQVFQKDKVQPEFKAVYDAYQKYSFEEDIQAKIVNTTRAVFHKKYKHTPCGQMIDSFMDYLSHL